MRTTVTIDDDVLAAIQEIARRDSSSAGRVLSDLARRALTTTGASGSTVVRNGFRVLPHRGPPVTNALIDRIRDDDPS